MATTADRKVNLVPPKLQRLRRARISLRAAMDDAQHRQREIREKLASARHNLSGLRAMPGASFMTGNDKTELQKEIEAAEATVEQLEELKTDIESELAEFSADYQPLCGTVRSLERYLGLHEDEHLFEGHRVTGQPDNFQVQTSAADATADDFYDSTKGEKS